MHVVKSCLFVARRALVFTFFYCGSLLRSHPGRCILSLALLFFAFSSAHIYHQFDSALDSHSLTLADLPQEYVRALNASIEHDEPFPYLTTPPPITTKIPRIIHHTYKTTSIPPHWSHSYESCRYANPSYTHYFWTDASGRDFIKTRFPWFLHTYDSYPYPIQRVDALRYFLLWHYGGVYIDMDIGCRRAIDPLLRASVWVPKTSPFGVSNDLMASTAGHPFMVKLATSLQDHNRSYVVQYLTVFWTTGPMFVNKVLAAWLSAGADFGAIDSNGTQYRELKILPSMFYDRTEYSFFGHVQGSSWHGSDVAVVRWMYERLWAFGGGFLAVLGLLYISRLRTRTKMPNNPNRSPARRGAGGNAV